ncbi:Protein CBG10209 [Caenorhabditis briggsae]|uniref:Citrate transport protein n=1 Tax=Caenorhabditis briggsae TaxID=6238 RepID=A8XAU9_CAEBR|nr:Protein CBG10209 [Caenorhabditis briggsae]CAP29764.2 Protein CBG10209 [Caenorhabditis briggsae]
MNHPTIRIYCLCIYLVFQQILDRSHNRPSLVSSSISSSTAATTSSPSSSTIPPPTTKTSLPAITTFLATLSFLVPLQSWVKSFAPSPTTSTSTTDSYAAAISSSPPGSSDPSSSTGSYLRKPSVFQKTLEAVFRGGITGCMSMMIVYPTEQVKTLSQLLNKDGKPVFNGPVDVIRKTLKEKGVRGLYSGLPILLIGNFPVTGCRFGTFEGLKGMVSGDNNKLTFIQSLLCGLGAGVSEAIFAVTPIEALKVKYLEDRRLAKPVYRNFVHAATSIARSQGISGLYKGVSATVMKQGSNQMVRFSVLESLKNLYTNGNESKDIPTPIIGVFGVIAGAASVYANTPVDVVKTRLQGANAAVYSSTTDCIKQIIKNEGPKAFYKGTVPRLTRVCIDVAFQNMIFKELNPILKEVFNKIF